MLKAIFAKHVKVGDVILVSGGIRISVAQTDQCGTRVRIADSENGYVDLGAHDIVGLGHRPEPEGKTEEDMLVAILTAFLQVTPFWLTARSLGEMEAAREVLKKAVSSIREAIDAYELGKPLEK